MEQLEQVEQRPGERLPSNDASRHRKEPPAEKKQPAPPAEKKHHGRHRHWKKPPAEKKPPAPPAEKKPQPKKQSRHGKMPLSTLSMQRTEQSEVQDVQECTRTLKSGIAIRAVRKALTPGPPQRAR